MDSSRTTNPGRISTWLSRAGNTWFSLYATSAAFCLYTCVYGFRKTFAVATFSGQELWGIDYKVWLVTFQVAGYALSKFIGIKLISELGPHSRSLSILLGMTIAGLAWFCFAITPAPYNLVFLFVNGIPLGLIWGMIFSYLEGRQSTELLGAGLCVSFVFSAGFVKSVGAYIMTFWGTSEQWMPFVASCLFTVPLIFFTRMLDRLPPPTAADEALRTKRKPMNAAERKSFVRSFLPGIVLFIIAYMGLTAFRDFRDNFSAEMWNTLGFSGSPAIFTQTEIPVSLGVLVIMGSLVLIRENRLALMVNHLIILAGMLLVGLATLLFVRHLASPVVWMVLVGLGLYMGYVPFNCIFFERMLATFRFSGTVGFIMYVADAFGYLASVAVLFFKEFSFHQVSWLHFFVSSGYILSIGGTLLITGSMVYFAFRRSPDQARVNTGSEVVRSL